MKTEVLDHRSAAEKLAGRDHTGLVKDAQLDAVTSLKMKVDAVLVELGVSYNDIARYRELHRRNFQHGVMFAILDDGAEGREFNEISLKFVPVFAWMMSNRESDVARVLNSALLG